MRIKIKKGLDIPIKGEPEKAITDGAENHQNAEDAYFNVFLVSAGQLLSLDGF